ncbi:MAG: GFA family protein [Myxococcota bacterium]
MTGGCQCGAVRYRIEGPPKAVTACHCRECQRQSGSAFGMSLIVARDGFHLDQGDVQVYSRVGESGLEVAGAFCGICGTRLYHDLERNPTTRNVKAGTLDDPSECAPILHVWTDSRQRWFTLPEAVPHFGRNPGE